MAKAIRKKLFAPGDACPSCKHSRLCLDPVETGAFVVKCGRCLNSFAPDVRRCSNYQLAEQIAADLFTDGQGGKASRLVSELSDGRLGGGWCEGAVVDRIADLLDERGNA